MVFKMAKNSVQDIVTEIRKNLEGKKLILGTGRTIKSMRGGKIEKVYVTSNCPANVMDDLKYYTKLSKAQMVQLDMPNDELGTLCKKPFAISVVGLLRV